MSESFGIHAFLLCKTRTSLTPRGLEHFLSILIKTRQRQLESIHFRDIGITCWKPFGNLILLHSFWVLLRMFENHSEFDCFAGKFFTTPYNRIMLVIIDLSIVHSRSSFKGRAHFVLHFAFFLDQKKSKNVNRSFSKLRRSWAPRFCRVRALYIYFGNVVRNLRNLTWISPFWSFEIASVIKSCQFRWVSLKIQQNSSGISLFSAYFHRFTYPNHFQTDSNMFGNDFSSQTQINHQKYHPKYVSAQKLKNEVNSPFKSIPWIHCRNREILRVIVVKSHSFRNKTCSLQSHCCCCLATNG